MWEIPPQWTYPNKQNIDSMGEFQVQTKYWSHWATVLLCTMPSKLLCVVGQRVDIKPDDWRPSCDSQLLNNLVVDSMTMHWNAEIAMCTKGQLKVNCPDQMFRYIRPIPSPVELHQLKTVFFSHLIKSRKLSEICAIALPIDPTHVFKMLKRFIGV